MSEYETNDQPCNHFKPDEEYESLGHTHHCPDCDGQRVFCTYCHIDHHAGGWWNCTKIVLAKTKDTLSALTRERDEAREKVADQIVPGCASVTGDPVENAAEAHKRIEKERDELKADYLKLDAYCAPLREVISDLKARCEKAEKVVSAVRKMREANFQEFFTAYREAIEAVDAADALAFPQVL